MDSLAEKNKMEGTKDIQYKFDNDEVEERTTKNNLLAIGICSCLCFLLIVDADFYKMLESTYDILTTQNRLILMLQHLGKSDEEIADILCISKGSMRSYLSRIRACKKQ